MLRITSIVLACLFFAFPAQAKQFRNCIESGTVMSPTCMGQNTNPAPVARSIRATMHRERPKLVRRLNDTKLWVKTTIPGIVRSASGATAHVAASATQAFQCLVDRLDAVGYPVRFMGGWRAHGSVPGSLHPAGLALDVNQLARNVTRPAMPSNEISMANDCGLISGRQWRWADSGHFQLGGWAGSPRHYASRHRRHQYTSAR